MGNSGSSGNTGNGNTSTTTEATTTGNTTSTSTSTSTDSITIGNININVAFRQLADDENDLVSASINVKNDLPDPLNVEIRTPGGLYYLGDRYVPIGETVGSKLLQGTYDMVFTSTEGKKTLSSVSIAHDINLTASDIFKGDTSAVITNPETKVSFDDPVSALFSKAGLDGYIKIYSGTATDEVRTVLRQLRATGEAEV